MTHKVKKIGYAFIGLIGFALVLTAILSLFNLKPKTVILYEVPFGLADKTKIALGHDLSDSLYIEKLKKPLREKYHMAKTVSDSGHVKGAIALWKEIAEQKKNCMPIYAQIVWTLLKDLPRHLQDTVEIEAWLQKGLAIDPDYPWLWYAKGVYQSSLGRNDLAKQAYIGALQRAPQFAFPHIALGKMDLQSEEFSKAKHHFRTAIALLELEPKLSADEKDGQGPFFPVAPYDELAYTYYSMGQEDSAFQVIAFADTREMKIPRLQFVRALLFESQGNLRAARRIYQLLLKRDPTNVDVLTASQTVGLKASFRLKESNQRTTPKDDALFAISILEPLAHKYPRNAPLWMALGQAYVRRGLLAVAHESLDSGYKYDSTLEGLKELRQLITSDWLNEAKALGERVSTVPRTDSIKIIRKSTTQQMEAEEGENPLHAYALLGNYSVAWGTSREDMMRAYPRKKFTMLPSGHMLDVFNYEGVKHEYLLAYKNNKFWGVRIFVTDSSAQSGDVFGHMIALKAKISGEGKGTGESSCSGYRNFQGAIWENDDNFEFMAQFSGKENQVRMVRMNRENLPVNRRLCDFLRFLDADYWK